MTQTLITPNQQQENVQAARKAYEKGEINKQNLDAFEQSAEKVKGTLPDTKQRNHSRPSWWHHHPT